MFVCIYMTKVYVVRNKMFRKYNSELTKQQKFLSSFLVFNIKKCDLRVLNIYLYEFCYTLN